MNTARRLLLTACMAPVAAMLSAQPNTIDPGFGEAGLLASPLPTGINTQTTGSILELSDGYFLGLGYSTLTIGFFEMRSMLMKYDLCGIPDSTFGTDGHSTVIYESGSYLKLVSAQELPDGKILCAANYSSGGAVSTDRPALFRLMPDGTLDLSYGTNGVLITQPGPPSSGNFGSMIKMPGDTLIVAVGRYTSVAGGQPGTGLARLLPDGSPDVAFGPGGLRVYNYPDMGYSQAEWEQVHLANDSTIFLTRAESTDLGATYRAVVYAFDTSGTIRNTFGTNGRVEGPTPLSFLAGAGIHSTLDAQGRLLIASCGFLTVAGVTQHNMIFMRFLSDGTLDTNFGDNGTSIVQSTAPTFFGIRSGTITAEPDGRILASYVNTFGDGTVSTSFVRLEDDGTPVPGSQLVLATPNLGITGLLQLDDDRWLAQAFGGGPVQDKRQVQLRLSNVPVVLPTIALNGSDLVAAGSGPEFQWTLDGEMIPGATDGTFTPTGNGSYVVVMTDDLGCVHASEPYVLLNVGIPDGTSSGLQVINTLALEQLFVRYDGSPVPYELLSIGGQRLATGQLVQGMNTLNVSGLAQGIYLLRAVNADGPAVHRFLKQ